MQHSNICLGGLLTMQNASQTLLLIYSWNWRSQFNIWCINWLAVCFVYCIQTWQRCKLPLVLQTTMTWYALAVSVLFQEATALVLREKLHHYSITGSANWICELLLRLVIIYCCGLVDYNYNNIYYISHQQEYSRVQKSRSHQAVVLRTAMVSIDDICLHLFIYSNTL